MKLPDGRDASQWMLGPRVLQQVEDIARVRRIGEEILWQAPPPKPPWNISNRKPWNISNRKQMRDVFFPWTELTDGTCGRHLVNE